jgi:hypothetical protein
MLPKYATLLTVSNTPPRGNASGPDGPSEATAKSSVMRATRLDRDALAHALRQSLARALPDGWHYSLLDDAGGSRLEIQPKRGPAARLSVVYKTRLHPADVHRLDASPLPQRLVVSPFLSRQTQAALREHRTSYVDAAGNIWLATDSLLVERSGLAHAPSDKNSSHSRNTLRGSKTARIVRFLCDHRPPFKVRHIALETNLHPGNVSRILQFLDQAHLIERSSSGTVTSVDWEGLIERWALDLKSQRIVESFLDPYGLQNVLHGLTAWTKPYAVTGPYAAYKIAPAEMTVAIDLYVTNIEAAGDDLQLQRTGHIGNVRLIRAYDGVVFEKTKAMDGMNLAAPSQIAADLLTVPIRSRQTYIAMIDWMKEHESDWRE